MNIEAGLEADFYGVDSNCFKLNNYIYEVVEDPSDGYRSSMEDVRMKDDTDGLIFFNQPLARVRVEKQTKWSPYGWAPFEGFRLVDVVDGHIWLIFGTDNSDDYYPSFTFFYETKEQKVLNILES